VSQAHPIIARVVQKLIKSGCYRPDRIVPIDLHPFEEAPGLRNLACQACCNCSVVNGPSSAAFHDQSC